jgi:hypothetical protein
MPNIIVQFKSKLIDHLIGEQIKKHNFDKRLINVSSKIVNSHCYHLDYAS